MSLGGIIGQAPDLNEYLPKSGGTMTGPLVLSGNPSNNLEAASKQYVDEMAGWKVLTKGRKELTSIGKTGAIVRFDFNIDETNIIIFKIKWEINVKRTDASVYVDLLGGTYNIGIGSGTLIRNVNQSVIISDIYSDGTNIGNFTFVTSHDGQKTLLYSKNGDIGNFGKNFYIDFSKAPTSNNTIFSYAVYAK